MEHLPGDLMMVYSLSNAATAIGKTRQAVQAAIKKGTISAHKNELGEWEIDPAELHRVYPPVKHQVTLEEQGLTFADADNQMQIFELRCQLEAANKMLEDARTRADELKQERDDWKREAEDWKNQVKALPPGQDQDQQPRKGFLARLFGR
jgi:FtsZ-binding cell division protein ZapB